MSDSARLHQLFTLKDGRLYWKRRPSNRIAAGQEAGTMNGQRYWQIRFNGRFVNRSRVVFCMVHGRWPDGEIDHINRDSLDDRPENLREATRAQNNQNQGPRRKRSPLPQGVYQHRRKYKAQITVNHQPLYLGLFDTREEAAAAYQIARVAHFGEFA